MHNISTESPEQQQDKYRNHAQVWELLPWYINGSLPDREQQHILEHAAVCLICRKELGLQSAVRDAVKSHELDDLMVTASFARLSAKLHEQEMNLQVAPQDAPTDRERNAGKFAGALHLWLLRQFKPGYLVVALTVLAVVLIIPRFTAELFPGNNTFQTLSNAQTEVPVAADLRLIFADSVSESERDAILGREDLAIVSGPDDRGLYRVSGNGFSAGALDATLKRLRSREEILFAEFVINPAPDIPPSGER